jgi:hypothetical protein
MLPKPVYWTILLLICAYAVWRGRGDERAAAATCLGASLIQMLVISPAMHRYSGVEIGVLAVDLGVLAVFVAIALQSSRFWPLWVAGLQLTTVLGHILKAVQLSLLPLAYAGAPRWTHAAPQLSGRHVPPQEVASKPRHAQPAAPLGQARGLRGTR